MATIADMLLSNLIDISSEIKEKGIDKDIVIDNIDASINVDNVAKDNDAIYGDDYIMIDDTVEEEKVNRENIDTKTETIKDYENNNLTKIQKYVDVDVESKPAILNEVNKKIAASNQFDNNKLAEIYLAGIGGINTTENVDVSDPLYQNAQKVASNIINDFIKILSNHMKIDPTDKIIVSLLPIQKLIAHRYFFNPKLVYTPSEILRVMGQKLKISKPGKIKKFPYDNNDEDDEVNMDNIGSNNGNLIRDNANKELSNNNESFDDTVYDSNSISAHDAMKIIEERNRKISHTKNITKTNINSWLYLNLPCHKFLKVLSGSFAQDHLNTLITTDLSKLIFGAWVEKNERKMESCNVNDVEKHGLYSMEDISNEVDTYDNSQKASEKSIFSYIDMDRKDPKGFSLIFYSPTILSSIQRAWNIVESMLIKLKGISPNCVGFSRYKCYNSNAGVPDIRLIYSPLVVSGGRNIQLEFSALVSVFICIAKELSMESIETRFQIKRTDIRYSFALHTLCNQMSSIGFTGIENTVNI